MVPPALDALGALVSPTISASPVLAQGIPAGPELLILLMIFGLFGFVPLLVLAAGVYFVYDTRKQLGELREEVERLKQGE
ncbi:hypothetical protein JCM17823_14420 [Halorubrum gandharaense]